MATSKVTPIQFLRSEVLNKRPDPAKMLPGQPAVNTEASQPGLFFADSTGSSLVKVGPCSVGVTAPNTGATGAAGQLGNTLGELWLDTAAIPGPILRVWDGTQWTGAVPSAYGSAIVSATPPVFGTLPDGTLWWDSSSNLMYILYDDGSTRQWIQTPA